MKRYRQYPNQLDSSSSGDVAHNRRSSFFSRSKKALLKRPSEEDVRLNEQKQRNFKDSVVRISNSKKLGKYDYLYDDFSSNELRKSLMNLPIRSDDVFNNNQSNQTPIDSLLAVAAAATAELQKSKSNSEKFMPLARDNGDSAATVAAVAAAMNAAAMAAALGAGNMFTNKSFSDLNKTVSSPVGACLSKRLNHDNLTSILGRNHLKSSGLKRGFDDELYNSKTRKSVNISNRFPHHLDHRDPEDDPSATRTLFVGNLPPDISVEELHESFEKYGLIEDIDIKRRDPESGVTSYAFIRYVNLDMAHRAKIDMSGREIGEFICKIGYGKVVPTQCLWIGGLGPWITYPVFATLLDKLGPERIIWPSGKNYANVLFPTVEMAVVAANVLRGYPLGGNDRRIRVDFTNESHMVNDPLLTRYKTDFMQRSQQKLSNNRLNYDSRFNESSNKKFQVSQSKRRKESYSQNDVCSVPRKRESFHKLRQAIHTKKVPNKIMPTCDSSFDVASESSNNSVSRPRSSSLRFCNSLETATNVKQLSMYLNTVWDANFYLKSSCFPCRMHFLRGDRTLIDQIMSYGSKSPHTLDTFNESLVDEENSTICLRITQRMRLDPMKLDDINQRIETCRHSGSCILLALAKPNMTSSSQTFSDLQKQPRRPLRNLVAYLKSKDSAGVVLINHVNTSECNSKSTEDKELVTSMLHALPPCDFAHNFLKEHAPGLQNDYTNDDYLVILLIRNTPGIL